MGLRILGSASRNTAGCSYPTDPNPSIFDITALKKYGSYVLVTVTYKNCTNFEGEKLLIIKGSIKEILKLNKLDPHFLKTNNIMARFRPDEEGKRLAELFCISISHLKET